MLGAGASGKRSLNRVWFNGGKWQLEWDPTIEDYWRKNVQFTFDNGSILFMKNKENIDLSIAIYDVIDRVGNCDNYAASYEQAVRNGELFFVCFSLISAGSFQYAKEVLLKIKRIKDPMQNGNNFGVILIGCKCDLKHLQQISETKILETVDQYNIPYVETSAKNNVNVDLLSKLCIHEYWVQINSGAIKWT
eukprot:171632_1